VAQTKSTGKGVLKTVGGVGTGDVRPGVAQTANGRCGGFGVGGRGRNHLVAKRSDLTSNWGHAALLKRVAGKRKRGVGTETKQRPRREAEHEEHPWMNGVWKGVLVAKGTEEDRKEATNKEVATQTHALSGCCCFRKACGGLKERLSKR